MHVDTQSLKYVFNHARCSPLFFKMNRADQRTEGNGWSGGKGGDLRMEKPGQSVLVRI